MNPFKKPLVRRAALTGVVLAASGALLVTALPAIAEGQNAAIVCKPQKLSTATYGGPSGATSISRSGQYIGGYVSTPRTSPSPVMWDYGEFYELSGGPSLPSEGISDGKVLGINDGGAAVGKITFEGNVIPFKTDDTGRMQPLDNLVEPGETADDETVHGEALAINDQGMTVGHTKGPDDHPLPVRWSAFGAEPVVLELPEDAVGGKALDIDWDGQVAGHYTKEDGKKVAAIWDADGVITDRTEHPDSDAQITSLGDGTHVGNVDDAAAIWRDGEDEPEVIPDSAPEVATNTDGDITGSLNPDKPQAFYIRGFNGEEIEMQETGDGRFATPTAINQNGSRISGYTITPHGIDYPVEWTCDS